MKRPEGPLRRGGVTGSDTTSIVSMLLITASLLGISCAWPASPHVWEGSIILTVVVGNVVVVSKGKKKVKLFK